MTRRLFSTPFSQKQSDQPSPRNPPQRQPNPNNELPPRSQHMPPRLLQIQLDHHLNFVLRPNRNLQIPLLRTKNL